MHPGLSDHDVNIMQRIIWSVHLCDDLSVLYRLDQSPGSGFHVTPQGVEFDQQYLRLGRITLRGSAGITFPRCVSVMHSKDIRHCLHCREKCCSMHGYASAWKLLLSLRLPHTLSDYKNM